MHIMQVNITSLPGTLSANGYKTCLISKSHFNEEQYHGYQPDPGREEKYGINGLGDVLGNSGPSEIPNELMQT